MTDLLTRKVDEQRKEARPSIAPFSAKLVVVPLSLMIGILVGWALFNDFGPSREQLAEARWEQVVDYYSEQYDLMTEAHARAERAHWQEVVDHYSRQYTLIADATNQPAPRNDAVYWQAVVDYYERQWELRNK